MTEIQEHIKISEWDYQMSRCTINSQENKSRVETYSS